jgi:hypothetical protein
VTKPARPAVEPTPHDASGPRLDVNARHSRAFLEHQLVRRRGGVAPLLIVAALAGAIAGGLAH